MKISKSILLLPFFLPSLSVAQEIPLTITDVIQSSLENNLEIQIDRYNPDIAEDIVEEKRAPFDPNFTLITGLTDSNKASASTFSDSISRSTILSGSAEVSKRFEYGTLTSLKYEALKTTSDSRYIGLNPQYDSSLTFLILQPLLKNRGTDVNTAAIEVNKNNVKIEEWNFKQKVIDVVSQSQKLYWDLYSANDQYGVKQKSLDLAKKFLEESKLKAKVGAIAPLDVLQAKSEVASRDEEIIVAENTVKNNQDTLLNYIYGNSKVVGDVGLREKPVFVKEEIDEDKLMQDAFVSRPDYLIAKLNVESSDINIVFAKNQKLPTVDLQGTLTANGLSGTRVGTSTTQFTGGFGSANDRMTSGRYYSAGVSLKVDFPWGLRQDRARYRTALYEKEKALLNLTKIEQQIILDVKTAIRNVLAADKRFHAAKVAAQLADETLEAEQKKYNVGLSTSYDVLQVQRDYTDAQVKHIKSTIDYQVAKINLYLVTGTTLERNNINIADVAEAKKIATDD